MSELRKRLAEEFADAEYAHAYLGENSNMRLAAQVRALRVQRNWSQQDLAERAGMKQARISKIEQADFDSLSLTTLRRLAAAFDVGLSVKFDSIANVVNDFLLLSPAILVCESRPASIERLNSSPAVATIVPASQSLTLGASLPASSTASNQLMHSY